MKKLLLAILGFSLIGVIYALQPMYYFQNTSIYRDVAINPSELLKDLTVINYTTPIGYQIYQLQKNGQIIGVLWENIKLTDVTIGSPFYTRWGVKYPIYHNGQFVGFIFDTQNYGHPLPRECGYGHCCGCGCCGCMGYWH
jgi:hypothetical protein